MTIAILITLTVCAITAVISYSLGYRAGLMAGLKSCGLGVRQDSRNPVCGRTLRPCDKN